MVKLTDEIKSGLLDFEGNFISDYHKHIYLALFYAELSEEKMQEATVLHEKIEIMTSRYEQLLVEANNYADKFTEEFETAKKLGE